MTYHCRNYYNTTKRNKDIDLLIQNRDIKPEAIFCPGIHASLKEFGLLSILADIYFI